MAIRRPSLGPGELEILRYVTEHHPITVREVADFAAATKGQARTTVLTMMERLRRKGFLRRKKAGGSYHYSPRLAHGEVLHNLLHNFVREVLNGSLSPFIAFLADGKNLTDEELASLKQVVSDLETQRRERST